MEINGGRFYVRPLHDDDRIDDRPALQAISDLPAELAQLSPATSRADWEQDTRYVWASCEQTSVDMVALVVLDLHADATTATLRAFPVGDPERVLPHDPALVAKTVADAATEGAGTVRRWAEGMLGRTVAQP